MAALPPPPLMPVPATPAIEGVDIRTLYNVDEGVLLGKGGFSEVLAVRHFPSGELRALKVMKREALVGKKGEMVAHEKEILRRTCHPNIVTLYEAIQTPDRVYFALDLMNEDLFEFIVRNKRVNEKLARKIMFSVLSGIAYLHEQSVVHRDIKPENILINVVYPPTPNNHNHNATQDGTTPPSAQASDGSSPHSPSSPRAQTHPKLINDYNPDEVEVLVKLADFGLAKLVREWDVRSTPCGTSFYIAPEVIRGIEQQGARPLVTNQQLVKSVDVWSAGVVLYVLLCGRPPFHGQVKTTEERRALLRKIDHGVLFNPNHGWGEVSNEAKDLILRMLDQDSAHRISAMESLRHPFFTQHGYAPPTMLGGMDPYQRQKEEQQRRREASQRAEAAAAAAHARGQTTKPATTTSSPHSNTTSPTSVEEKGADFSGRGKASVAKPKKSGGIFDNVVSFFTGGTHGRHASAKDDASRAEQQKLHEELAALQRDVIEADDAEGDQTAYAAMPVLASRPTKPAVMNAKAKIGPGALKK